MNLLIKGGRVIDPAQQLDARLDVLVGNGAIKEVGFDGSSVHGFAQRLQEKLVIFPDYGFKGADAAQADAVQPETETLEPASGEAGEAASGEPASNPWPSVSAGTTVSGFVGALLTLLLAGIAGVFIVKRVSGWRNWNAAR